MSQKRSFIYHAYLGLRRVFESQLYSNTIITELNLSEEVE